MSNINDVLTENVVIILENNPNWAQITSANLPAKLRDTTSFLFIIEDRIGTTDSIIKDNFKDLSCNYFILTSSEIIEYWDKSHERSSFMHKDTLSSNILALWYIKETCPNVKQVLMLDDDIVLQNNFEDVFDIDGNLFCRSAFMNLMPRTVSSASKNMQLYWNELFNIFDWHPDDEEYIQVRKQYICTGTRKIVLDQIDFDYYEQSLIRFYDSKLFEVICDNKDKNKAKYWYLTELFENIVWRDILNNALYTNKLCFTFFASIAKTTDSALRKATIYPILHIACGKSKKALYNKLIELDYIKGNICE